MSEVALWRAVIAQAVSDAVRDVHYGDRHQQAEALRERDEARAWLLGFGRDFREVCALADMEASRVRDYASALAVLGWPRQRQQEAA